MILRTYTPESPRRVSGRSYHHNLVRKSVIPCTHRKRLTLLERSGLHHGISFRPIPIKRYVQIRQSQMCSQSLTLVSHGSPGTFQRPANRHPVRVPVNTGQIISHLKLTFCIICIDQSCTILTGTFQLPLFILKSSPTTC